MKLKSILPNESALLWSFPTSPINQYLGNIDHIRSDQNYVSEYRHQVCTDETCHDVDMGMKLCLQKKIVQVQYLEMFN